MLAAAPPTAFLATTDRGRAREFFEVKLGLPLVSESQFALVYDCAAVPLRVTFVEAMEPADYTVFGWHVGSAADSVDGLAERGVVFERFPGLEQDERGIWVSPSGARVAWFRDPDGNVLSITQV